MKQVLLLTLSCLILGLLSCKTPTGASSQSNVKLNKLYSTESGLQYSYTQLGTGARAKTGDKVSVHYIGKLTDGKEFDNSYKRGAPISFVIGSAQVITGLEEGVALMNVGDKATFTMPAAIGYGAIEIPGTIPANSVLVFDVELLEVEPAKQ